MENEVIPVL